MISLGDNFNPQKIANMNDDDEPFLPIYFSLNWRTQRSSRAAADHLMEPVWGGAVCTSTSHYASVRVWAVGFSANNGGMTPLVCFPADVKRGEARGGRRSVKRTSRAWCSEPVGTGLWLTARRRRDHHPLLHSPFPISPKLPPRYREHLLGTSSQHLSAEEFQLIREFPS